MIPVLLAVTAAHGQELLAGIGIAIVGATAGGLLAKALRQPLLLGYLVAGIALGPEMGFGLVHQRESIAIISEIGLILLLFIIGLEMDLQKLLGAGRALTAAGLLQFPLGLVLGLAFAKALGFALSGGRLDALYLAVAMALSSTMIVVKLLYDKYELMTLPGRLTLGILVFQDVWAILFLALQPTLLTPSAGTVLVAVVKAAALVAASLAAARYVLPAVFAFVAKVPELLLVCSLAWCFLVAGAAGALGLSKEMGALVAGVGLCTFPYNLDVVAKVINIRDFFVTLFFVALGMQIPRPTPSAIGLALSVAAFIMLSRLVVVPILLVSGAGLRASILPAVNLSQLSEFSLVIASLGLALGHIGQETVAVLTFAFAVTAVASTYLISFSHPVQSAALRVLGLFGLKDEAAPAPEAHGDSHVPTRPVVFLGFYRDASSILHQFELGTVDGDMPQKILVIDFSPTVLRELRKRGVACLYGDVASLDTLQQAAVHGANVVVSTITDAVLKGTTNLRLLRKVRKLAPAARAIVAADTIAGALALYEEGADFVFLPRLHSAHDMAEVIRGAMDGDLGGWREEEMERLRQRTEVLA
jgi:Kef-type K+ transport system membrane component KefB